MNQAPFLYARHAAASSVLREDVHTPRQVKLVSPARTQYREAPPAPGSHCADFYTTAMNVEQAKQRILALLAENSGSLPAAIVEADEEHAQNQQTVSAAAAHALATESDIITGEEQDAREWFPYSFITRASEQEG